MNGHDHDAERKSWTTLVARAALQGCQLWRTDPDDGVQRYFLGRLNLIRVIANVDELERLLDQTQT